MRPLSRLVLPFRPTRSTRSRATSRVALLVYATTIALLAAGCTGGNGDNTASGTPTPGPTTSSSGAPPRPEDADLVIWEDPSGVRLLQGLATEFGKENGIKVVVQPISGDVQAAFVTAASAGKGPDIVVGAHDWIGNLVQNGTIAPVRLSSEQKDEFRPVATEAVTLNGNVYGVPYVTENLALYRNTALVPTAPATFEQMASQGQALVQQKKAEVPLAAVVSPIGNPYNAQPYYTSAGGYIFGKKSNGEYNPADLGVGKAGSLEAAKLLAKYGEKGQNVFRRSITGDNAISLFTSNKAPFLVSGPWALPQVRSAKVKYALSPVPRFASMQPARPFIGVQAFFVSAKAENAVLAQEFATKYITRPKVQKALYEAEPRPPALTSVYDEVVKTDSDVRAFTEAGNGSQPLPQIPAMASVWDALGRAEAAIIGGADPIPTMTSAGQEIKKLIADS